MKKLMLRKRVKAQWQKSDITLRIFLSFAFVLSVSLIFTGVLFNSMYSKNYIRSYTKLLTRQGKKISNRVGIMSRKNKISNFEKYSLYIDEIEQAEQTDIWIISNKKAKTPLNEDFTNAETEDGSLTKEMEQVLQGAFAGDITSSSSYDQVYGMMILRVAVPIYGQDKNDVQGSVMMVSMIDKQSMGLREGTYLITVSVVVALFLASILALFFANVLSRPINKLGREVSRIEAGDYSKMQRGRGNGQLAVLEGKLDKLAEKLAKTEEEHAGLEQARRDFFANVSHELRTPVTVVRGYSEMLADGVVTDPEKIQETYGRILGECQGMERLVRDLFVLSKMQNPDFQIEREPIGLVQMFQDIVRSGRVLGQDKNVVVELQAPEQEPMVILGDYGRIQQMFMIILDNAIKFSKDGGKVEIALSKSEDAQKFEVSIRDYGVGISKEELPYIFEKFYKSKMKQNEKGTGLGLMIAKQIALRHDCEIQVYSEEGKGTTFSFCFEELENPDEYV